jgi:hypothetical protein
MTEKPIVPRIALSIASGMFIAVLFIPSLNLAEKRGAPIFLLLLGIFVTAQAVFLRLIWGKKIWRFMWHHIIWPLH